MLQAIYNGMLENGEIEPLSPTCPTGNCTFDPFDSLGFCSECCDISADIEQICHSNGDTKNCTYRFPGNVEIFFNSVKPLKLMEVFSMPVNTTFPTDIGTCNVNPLGNAAASFGLAEVEPSDELVLKKAQFCALFPCVQRHNSSVHFGVVSSTVLSSWRNSSDNTYIGDPTIGAGQIEIWNNRPNISPSPIHKLVARSTVSPTALPRIIQPDSGVHDEPSGSTSVSIGFNYRLNYPSVVSDQTLVDGLLKNVSILLCEPLNLSESEVQVAILTPINTLSVLGYITTQAVVYFPTSAIPRLRRLLLQQSSNSSQPINSDPATQSLLSMIQYSYTQIPMANNASDNSSSYLVSQKRLFALNAWFADAFAGTVSQSYDLFRGIYSLDQIAASYDLMSVIYNHGNITATMANLATSMSNYVRDNGGAGTAVKGTALNMETYVHVRWEWLTLLVVCVLGTLCFLICAMISTKKHGAGIAWKSSALAALFHGLDERKSEASTSISQTTGQKRCVSGMESVARSIRVKLIEDADGIVKLRREVRELDAQ